MNEDESKNKINKKPLAPRLYPTSKFMFRLFTRSQAFIFKLSRGYLWKTINGSEICVIKMKGVKTGKIRSIPLMLVPFEEGVVLVASLGGADIHPTWYWNLKADPEIIAYVGSKKLSLVAQQVDDETLYLNQISQNAKKILEIGFNGGHSAETFLKSSENVIVHSVDIGFHHYVKFGYFYLKKKYKDRNFQR